MIEKLLEAYVANTKKEDSIWVSIKRMDIFRKAVFIYAIIGFLVILTILSFFENLISAKIVLFIIIMFITSLYLLCFKLENKHHKEWQNNLAKYEDDLQILKKLLEHFKLFDKNKIKQLICKYYQDIAALEAEENKKNTRNKSFYVSYIIPVIAFCIGRIDFAGTTNEEWFAIAIVIIVVLFSAKQLYASFQDLIGIIAWNQLQKEKYIVLRLQDILDTEFPIEEGDLLKKYIM